jgi:hypothetical protein
MTLIIFQNINVSKKHSLMRTNWFLTICMSYLEFARDDNFFIINIVLDYVRTSD